MPDNTGLTIEAIQKQWENSFHLLGIVEKQLQGYAELKEIAERSAENSAIGAKAIQEGEAQVESLIGILEALRNVQTNATQQLSSLAEAIKQADPAETNTQLKKLNDQLITQTNTFSEELARQREHCAQELLNQKEQYETEIAALRAERDKAQDSQRRMLAAINSLPKRTISEIQVVLARTGVKTSP